jgi:uncharacterized LabA/DUF88 family protein
MSMANYLYVDNSNVWIEGMRVAAVSNGLAPDIWTAQEHKICDYSWKIDFGRLLEFAGGNRCDIGRAVLYGSKPPPNDSLWAAAKRQGFEVVVHERSPFSGREKKLDTNIATDITADSFELMDPGRDEITLVAGDADYVPTIERLRKRGLRFDVCFWEHAAKELKAACTNFIPLDPYLEHLRLR